MKILIMFVFLMPSFANGFFLQAKNNEFFKDILWDSGKAEYQLYKLKINKYGIMRDASAIMILLKENFDEETLVKSESGKLEVIKYNFIREIPVGMYKYNQMASLFFKRDTGEIIKYTMSSQDGSGITVMNYSALNSEYLFFNSYFDGQGMKKIALPDGEWVFYDALPVYLRYRLKGKTHKFQHSFELKILSSLIDNKIPGEIKMEKAKVNVIKKKAFYKVIVKSDLKTEIFVFESNYPHALLEWRLNSSEHYDMVYSDITDYWNNVSLEYTEKINTLLTTKKKSIR